MRGAVEHRAEPPGGHVVPDGRGYFVVGLVGPGRCEYLEAAAHGLPTVAHYCAAKWGVIGLIKSVAREVAADGVTVNCVCPTNLDSDMIHNEAFYALFAPGIDNPTREQVIPGFASLNAIPVPWIEAIDISNAMLFLASPEARYITGEALHVSAGWNAFNAA